MTGEARAVSAVKGRLATAGCSDHKESVRPHEGVPICTRKWVDRDPRGKVEGIDTGACPLYLLMGEYHFSCTPEDTRRAAAAIKGRASSSWSNSVIFR
jgi:hypothetical protein